MPTLLDGGYDFSSPGTITITTGPPEDFRTTGWGPGIPLLRLNAVGLFTLTIDKATHYLLGPRFRVVQGAGATFAIATSGVSIQGDFRPSSAAFTQYEFTYVSANTWAIATYSGESESVACALVIDDSLSSGFSRGRNGPTGSATAAFITVWLGPFPSGKRLNSVFVGIRPNTGHSALPNFMPEFTVYQANATGNETVCGTGTDASASVAAYETAHEISCSFSPQLTDAGFFLLQFTNEAGTGSRFRPGLNVFSIRATLVL